MVQGQGRFTLGALEAEMSWLLLWQINAMEAQYETVAPGLVRGILRSIPVLALKVGLYDER